MTKIILNDVTNILTAGTVINNNSQRIENAIENTLSRDGTSPNEMNADLDMNNNRVYNLPEPIAETEPARKGDIDAVIAASAKGIIATKAEAEAGANNTKTMTPLRTKQQVDARLSDEPTAVAGADNSALMTPLTTKQSIVANAKDGKILSGQTIQEAYSALGNASLKNVGTSIGNVLGFGDFAEISTARIGEKFILRKEEPGSEDGWDMRIWRDASSVAGGTSGFVNAALLVDTETGANQTSIEWALVTKLTNNSNSGENVAHYSQATKLGGGQTWAGDQRFM